MPEGLMTPDGKPVGLEPVAEAEREFARAMAADTSSESAPPKRTKPADGDPESRPARRQRPGKNTRAASKAAKPAPPPQSDAERKQGVLGYAQMAVALLSLADSRTPDSNIAWKADAITLATYAEPIADAVVETAKHNQAFAGAIDRLTSVGPYAALLTVGVQVGAQIAANHGVTAAQAIPGVHDPKALVQAHDQAA